ncbi:hypothetical protein NQZ79_g3280 [Umbelopsis isabellina]|nr:hypothetical protein NQZ79_g3280 [Umbelopsis isabellina]
MPPSRQASPIESSLENRRDGSENSILKRKQVGRHRIFTNEQRKDRNRLAQAAFRERRSQYTKELKSVVEDLETIIKELQESNRETSRQLDEVKEENGNLRQLALAVIIENRSLQSHLKSSHSRRTIHRNFPGIGSNILLLYVSLISLKAKCEHLPVGKDVPLSPCTSVSEDYSDTSSVASDNTKMQNSIFAELLSNSHGDCHSESLTQGEFLSTLYLQLKDHLILVITNHTDALINVQLPSQADLQALLYPTLGKCFIFKFLTAYYELCILDISFDSADL